jgi:hypothetical protein
VVKWCSLHHFVHVNGTAQGWVLKRGTILLLVVNRLLAFGTDRRLAAGYLPIPFAALVAMASVGKSRMVTIRVAIAGGSGVLRMWPSPPYIDYMLLIRVWCLLVAQMVSICHPRSKLISMFVEIWSISARGWLSVAHGGCEWMRFKYAV